MQTPHYTAAFLVVPPRACYLMGESAHQSVTLLSQKKEVDEAKSRLMEQDLQTALVADDSLTERTHLSHILQNAGLEVIAARSGNEAVALAGKHQPDVIFMDIMMEDGDGYRACRQLKRNETTADIPVIMVSSKSNPVDLKWAERLGAIAYVVKPYADKTILEQLAAL